MFIDGDFKSEKGDCEHHYSPSCHPAQLGPEWKYGCLNEEHPGYDQYGFCPIVNCDGMKSKCEIKNVEVKP